MQSRISKLSAAMLIAAWLCGASVSAQSNGTSNQAQGSAGTQGIFRFGAGARAQGLGSAVVAMPLDASTIFWNPGGLDYLERRNVVTYYSPLIEYSDAKYYFVGLAYPILDFGTVGLAWLHYDVGDVPGYDASGAPTGSFTESQDEFFLSYARQIGFNVGLGGNFKFKRQELAQSAGRAFAVDLGLIYRPDFSGGVLENVSFGFSVLNAIRPTLKLGGTDEPQARTIRGGVAKSLVLGSRPDQANLFLAFEKPEGSSEGMRFNFGTEYVYQNLGMLRLGHNGGGLTFGGGVLYQNKFQIDYAFGKFGKDADGIGAIHRLSFTAHFGRTKSEMRDEVQAKVLRKIEEETRNKEAMNRRNEFDDKMTVGKDYFDKGEYFSAFINFSQARDIAAGSYATFTQKDKDEADIWVENANAKMEEEAKAKEAELAKVEREKTMADIDRLFIDEQTQKGKEYLRAGRYNEAIAEWKRGLERDPENLQLKDFIANTEKQISGRRSELLRKAQSFAAAGQIVEAVNLYNQLMNQPNIAPAELKSYQDKVTQLQKQLNVEQLYRQGYTEYINKNFCAAKSLFAQALQTDGSNAKIRKALYDADVRCNARPGPIPDAIRPRYLEAIGLLNNEDYAAALRILEEIQPQDRYNQRILSAIDQARAGLDEKSPKQR